jgi:hypothetical protein
MYVTPSVVCFITSLHFTSLLVGIAEEHCLHLLEDASFRGFQRHAGGKTVVSVTLPSYEQAPPRTIESRERVQCAELYFYKKGTSIESRPTSIYSGGDFTYDGLHRWLGSIIRQEGRFYNDFPYPVELFWHDDTTASSCGVILPGESIFQNTFIGHMFSVRSLPSPGEESNDDLTVDFTVFDGVNYRFSPNNRLNTCDFLADESHYDYEEKMIDREIECDNMALRLEKFKLEVLHSQRLGLNYVQPSRIPALTTGFEKIKMPEKTFLWLREWYDRVKEEAKISQTETSAGPCMNQV